MSSSHTNRENHPWGKHGLKGRVKSLRQHVYEAVKRSGKVEKGSGKKGDDDNCVIIYDASGNLIEEIWNDEDGAVW